MSVTAKLFRAARLSADVRALSSGDPARIANRAKNKVVGRALGPAWRRLWGRWL